MANVDYARLRRDILDFLRSPQHGDQFNVYHGNGLMKFLMSERGHPIDWPDVSPVKVVIQDLLLERIIVPGVSNGGAVGSGAWELPHYFISPHGRKVLENTEYEPHDPERYLERLNKEVPGLDAVISAYLIESLGCYRHGFNLAAAVMLGAASEKALLNLVESMKSVLKDPTFDKAIDKAQTIKQKQEVVSSHLPESKTLPGELAERLPQAVEFVFHALRIARNDAGHPTGRFVQPGVVHGNLVLFPSYLRTLRDLDAHFAKQGA